MGKVKVSDFIRDPERDEFISIKQVQKLPSTENIKKGAKVRVWGYGDQLEKSRSKGK